MIIANLLYISTLAVAPSPELESSDAEPPAAASSHELQPSETAASVATPALPAPNGFMAALRLGYGLPMGKFASVSGGRQANLSDEFSGQIPFWFELGYRISDIFIPAFYLSVGYPFLVKDGAGLAASECHISGVKSCSGNFALRVGLEFLVKPWPRASLSPWFGIGTGYESTGYVLKDDSGGEATVSYRGWEFFNTQLGLDYRTSRSVAVGPYVALSVGKYNSVSLSTGNQSIGTITIGSPLMHEWLQFGARLLVDY